jgi:enamine deaminase RidA (YjgF/YER057c/UK114 family)
VKGSKGNLVQSGKSNIDLLPDVRNHRDINETRRDVLGSNFPTSTMVQVMAMTRAELLREINAIAVLSSMPQRRS